MKHKVITAEIFWVLPCEVRSVVVEVSRQALRPEYIQRGAPGSRGQDRWFITIDGRARCCLAADVAPRTSGDVTLKQARHAKTDEHKRTWAFEQLHVFSGYFARWLRSLATEHHAAAAGVARFLAVAGSGLPAGEHDAAVAFFELLRAANYERRRHLLELVRQQCRVAGQMWNASSQVKSILYQEQRDERKRIDSVQAQVDVERDRRKRRGMLIEMD